MENRKIYLCTGSDSGYFNSPVFKKCIESYSKSEKTTNVTFLVEDQDQNVDTLSMKKVFVPWNEIKSKNYNRCIQHGEFAKFLDEANSDDIIIFTDGDIVLQRQFNDEEIDMILNLKSDEFLANYNMHKNSTMHRVIDHVGGDRNELIRFAKNRLDINEEELKNYKEMNTGVLISTKSNFLKLANIYSDYYTEITHLIPGFWNQQFLINLVVNKFFKYVDLPYSFHTHIHHSTLTDDGCIYNESTQMGVPSPVTRKNNQYVIDNQVILFAHKFPL